MSSTAVVCTALAFFVAAAVTRLLVVSGGLCLDTPNHRSSHTTVTPRGGGLAIAAAVCFAWAMASTRAQTGAGLGTAVVLVGGVMAFLGVLEDIRGLSPRARLACEFCLIAGLSAAGLRWHPEIWFPATNELGHLLLCTLGYGLTALWFVWFINLFNFMDGINGIATLQALSACIAYAIIGNLLNESSISLAALCLAGAAGGFLRFNFPKARIFLGDIGSLYFGAMLATLPLALTSNTASWRGFMIGPLATAPFVVDASCTLVRRLWARERLTEAHRSHTYQIAADKFRSHIVVALLYTAAAASGGVCAIMIADRRTEGVALGAALFATLIVACGLVQRRYLQSHPRR